MRLVHLITLLLLPLLIANNARAQFIKDYTFNSPKRWDVPRFMSIGPYTGTMGDEQHNLLSVAKFENANYAGDQTVFSRLKDDGTVVFSHVIDSHAFLRQIWPVPSGGWVACGSRQVGENDIRPVLVRLDGSGHPQWSVDFNVTDTSYSTSHNANAVKCLIDNTVSTSQTAYFIVGGHGCSDADSHGCSPWLARIYDDSNPAHAGNWFNQWTVKSINGQTIHSARVSSLQQTPSGEFWVLGNIYNPDHDSDVNAPYYRDGMLFHVDGQGHIPMGEGVNLYRFPGYSNHFDFWDIAPWGDNLSAVVGNLYFPQNLENFPQTDSGLPFVGTIQTTSGGMPLPGQPVSDWRVYAPNVLRAQTSGFDIVIQNDHRVFSGSLLYPPTNTTQTANAGLIIDVDYGNGPAGVLYGRDQSSMSKIYVNSIVAGNLAPSGNFLITLDIWHPTQMSGYMDKAWHALSAVATSGVSFNQATTWGDCAEVVEVVDEEISTSWSVVAGEEFDFDPAGRTPDYHVVDPAISTCGDDYIVTE